MDYATALKEGLPIGSGAVEGGASSGDPSPLEVAWSMVEGGDSDPHAGVKVLAGQSQMGTVLALIPTSFSHTPGVRTIAKSERYSK